MKDHAMKEMRKIIETHRISASAPCRIDMGGTLDIGTFYYPLSFLDPCTFNIAVDLRTRVDIRPHRPGYIRISSRGFDDAEFPADALPFKHPMGLMFAIAAHFRIDGIHIDIVSASPPRSALGGSSSAAVALIAAFSRIRSLAGHPEIPKDSIPLLAHAIEESVAGVPCGLQDQLAAAYGGINAWQWKGKGAAMLYRRRKIDEHAEHHDYRNRILLAYCGIPHESININSRWVHQFLSGEFRAQWADITRCTNAFVEALVADDISEAVRQMNTDTAIRLEMTPDVLDDMGQRLHAAALAGNCGARFTGAGGGGCVWALGPPVDIVALKPVWEAILQDQTDAGLLDFNIDLDGVKTHES
jgi:D-glycero-alpha-D-manno-heptose-7-phosphate kinase